MNPLQENLIKQYKPTRPPIAGKCNYCYDTAVNKSKHGESCAKHIKIVEAPNTLDWQEFKTLSPDSNAVSLHCFYLSRKNNCVICNKDHGNLPCPETQTSCEN